MKFRVEALTPIHIGTGEILSPDFDFLPLKRIQMMGIVESEKVFQQIGSENIDRWVNAIDKEEKILEFVKQWSPKTNAEDLVGRKIWINHQKPFDKLAVKQNAELRLAFQNPIQEGACLPGSSLKGAIRTALLTNHIDISRQEEIAFPNDKSQLSSVERGEERWNDKSLAHHFFGPNVKSDYLRLLQVGDFSFKDSELVLAEVIREDKKGYLSMYKMLGIWLECIPKGAFAEGRLKFDGHKLARIKSENEKILAKRSNGEEIEDKKVFQMPVPDWNWDDFLTDVNYYTDYKLDQELVRFSNKKLPTGAHNLKIELNKLRAGVNRLIDAAKEDKPNRERSCILRCGFGSGYHGMTGSWQKDTLNKKEHNELVAYLRALHPNNHGNGKKSKEPDNRDYPCTRRMCQNGIPFGFLKLTMIDDEQ